MRPSVTMATISTTIAGMPIPWNMSASPMPDRDRVSALFQTLYLGGEAAVGRGDVRLDVAEAPVDVAEARSHVADRALWGDARLAPEGLGVLVVLVEGVGLGLRHQADDQIDEDR